MRVVKILAIITGVTAVIVCFGMLIAHGNVAVLNPQGIIALKERNLIIVTILLSLLVVVPVFVMTGYITWKYRSSNRRADYRPDWDHNHLAETLWWGIPLVIIMILAGITWQSTHELDPYKKIASRTPAIKIQVIALQWKWLFIYPDRRIATVNYLTIPTMTPIDFELTSDAPMNSFWVPSLGGQVYAMSGMSTNLHLMASAPGDYAGSSANISGKGFAGMKFTVHATSQNDYQKWLTSAGSSSSQLNYSQYQMLAKPSENNAQATYILADDQLYDKVIMKYMGQQD